MTKQVCVLLHTRDMDDLKVEVFGTLKSAVERAISCLEDGDTAEDGRSAETALEIWNGDGSFEVWETEGRVALTLELKEVE